MPEKKAQKPTTANLPEGAHSDFAESMSYGDYLSLDSLLASQNPVSGEHDEQLFIIIHQATELWMKLILHELHAAVTCIRADDLAPAFKMLARVARIQSQLIQSWSVLSTMTPADYLQFRDQLGLSSGFQSYQYREIEFLLGNKKPALLAPHRHKPEIHDRLEAVLKAPSLYDEVLLLLARKGFAIDAAVTDRDWSQPYAASPSVEDAWLQIYQQPETHWELYDLAEKLVDQEDSFQQWRFRHLKTVSRIIGHKRGTGGTSGVNYLSKALDYSFFPELWSVRTAL
ncbi:tryptophan 2,3-dioxygenase [Pelagibius sp. Alg239-R121]|uniref:tryptophan 2,3-dioxygenase n=1 Tax=Pelagibius sp. Alg239-R121 TaxID=2993448 RepID=UPI0024A6CAB6|nr:tryptophan 2,3-dioxygenase [Pelagibius sp. Alg239-R121]